MSKRLAKLTKINVGISVCIAVSLCFSYSREVYQKSCINVANQKRKYNRFEGNKGFCSFKSVAPIIVINGKLLFSNRSV